MIAGKDDSRMNGRKDSKGDSSVTSVSKLFGEAEIARRVEDLARDIAAEISGDFVIVGLLKGSFVFLADLVRALDRAGLAPRVEFMRVASYGLGKESSGKIDLIGDILDDISGRRVLLVDDIVDTGRSLLFARDLLKDKGAARIWTCVLLDKPSRREVDCTADFVGFVIEDVFVVGYGVDYAEGYRHLPYIGVVE
jgi:hypoxanthine phosphoribosyltransferase